MKSLIKYLDKLEDGVRMRLSHRSILYAGVGGIAFVLFWRGVWHTADILMGKGGVWYYIFYEPNSLVWTAVILLITGLFVSLMIGDRIILSGLKQEKELGRMTEKDIVREESEIESLASKINRIQKELEEIKNSIPENK
jgi:hypothetical protein